MPRKPVAFRIDEELLKLVDAMAADLGQTRTVFVERALEKALAGSSESRPKDRAVAGSNSVPASPRVSTEPTMDDAPEVAEALGVPRSEARRMIATKDKRLEKARSVLPPVNETWAR